MKDLGLVRHDIYGVYYIYLGDAALGFDPAADEIWGWVIEKAWDSYEESEVKILW